MAFPNNLIVPGLSPLYPDITCLSDYCLVTTGGEINAAATISSLKLSPYFDLSRTYWLIIDIGCGTPDHITLGAVFSNYAVQGVLEFPQLTGEK